MGNYSTEEIRAFKLKDILNSRMSALKAASLLWEGSGKDLGHPAITTVKNAADEFYTWLRQGQDVDTKPEPSIGLGNTPGATLGQLPEPTLTQKKVLDAIAGKQNKTQVDPQLKADVLRWAEETHNIRSYPTKLDSVEKFIEWNNKQ